MEKKNEKIVVEKTEKTEGFTQGEIKIFKTVVFSPLEKLGHSNISNSLNIIKNKDLVEAHQKYPTYSKPCRLNDFVDFREFLSKLKTLLLIYINKWDAENTKIVTSARKSDLLKQYRIIGSRSADRENNLYKIDCTRIVCEEDLEKTIELEEEIAVCNAQIRNAKQELAEFRKQAREKAMQKFLNL